MKGAEVEVEVNTLLLAGGSILGVFLYHPDPDGRAETEAELYREGAQFIVHPYVEDPARIGGTAIIADSTLMITVGSQYVISPLEVPVDAAKRAKRVAVFCLREPFQAGDRTEGTVLAASLPLYVMERGQVRERTRPASGREVQGSGQGVSDRSSTQEEG